MEGVRRIGGDWLLYASAPSAGTGVAWCPTLPARGAVGCGVPRPAGVAVPATPSAVMGGRPQDRGECGSAPRAPRPSLLTRSGFPPLMDTASSRTRRRRHWRPDPRRPSRGRVGGGCGGAACPGGRGGAACPGGRCHHCVALGAVAAPAATAARAARTPVDCWGSRLDFPPEGARRDEGRATLVATLASGGARRGRSRAGHPRRGLGQHAAWVRRRPPPPPISPSGVGRGRPTAMWVPRNGEGPLPTEGDACTVRRIGKKKKER